jgi:Na+/melibiose symporter-like transporter
MKILGFIASFIISSLIVFFVSYCIGYKHGVRGMTDLFIKKQEDEESEDTE